MNHLKAPPPAPSAVISGEAKASELILGKDITHMFMGPCADADAAPITPVPSKKTLADKADIWVPSYIVKAIETESNSAAVVGLMVGGQHQVKKCAHHPRKGHLCE